MTDSSNVSGTDMVTITVTELPSVDDDSMTTDDTTAEMDLSMATVTGRLQIQNTPTAPVWRVQTIPGTCGTLTLDSIGGWIYRLGATAEQTTQARGLRDADIRPDTFNIQMVATVSGVDISATITIQITSIKYAPAAVTGVANQRAAEPPVKT